MEEKSSDNSTKYTGRGAALYRAVEQSPKTNKVITDAAGYKENTIYDHYKKNYLSDSVMIKYGRAIPFDFSIEFPELKKYTNLTNHKEPNLVEIQANFEILRDKYTNLLEEYSILSKKYNDLKDENIQLKASKSK